MSEAAVDSSAQDGVAVTPLERRRQRWIRAQRLGRDEIADLPPHFDPGADYDVAPANEEPKHG